MQRAKRRRQRRGQRDAAGQVIAPQSLGPDAHKDQSCACGAWMAHSSRRGRPAGHCFARRTGDQRMRQAGQAVQLASIAISATHSAEERRSLRRRPLRQGAAPTARSLRTASCEGALAMPASAQVLGIKREMQFQKAPARNSRWEHEGASAGHLPMPHQHAQDVGAAYLPIYLPGILAQHVLLGRLKRATAHHGLRAFRPNVIQQLSTHPLALQAVWWVASVAGRS